MAQALGKFSPINPDESEVFAFDFVKDLPFEDSITSIKSVTLVVASGTDPNPQSHVSGQDFDGTKVSARLTGLLAGVTYVFAVEVNTANANILELWGYIACVPVP